MTQTKQLEYPYFGMGSNNAVVSLYAIHPELLALDDAAQRGKPFLFYIGGHFQEKSGREIEEGWGGLKPYVGKRAELADLLDGRTNSFTAEWLKVKPYAGEFTKLPEYVMINGERVEAKTLSSGWVPFSFGVGHEYDCKRFQETNGGNVRLDLEEFKDVLARFEEMKKDRAEHEATLGYRVKRIFGMA